MDKSRKLGSNRVTSALALPSIFFLALVLLSFYLSARVYIGARACSCKEKKKVDEAGSGRVREKERERERERETGVKTREKGAILFSSIRKRRSRFMLTTSFVHLLRPLFRFTA